MTRENTVNVPTEPTPEMLEPFARVLCSALNLDPDEPEAPHGEWPTWYGQCAPLAAAYREALSAAPLHEGEGEPVGCAEREIGRAVYERIETLIGGNSAELDYLADLVASVEEYGSYSGPTTAPPPSVEVERLREALEKIAAGYAGCDGFQDAQVIATEALAVIPIQGGEGRDETKGGS